VLPGEPMLKKAPSPHPWPMRPRPGAVRSLAEREADSIREALARTGGNKSRAAELLGVHRNTLLRKIRRYGITWD